MHRIIACALTGAIVSALSLPLFAATAPADPVPLQALYAAPKAPWMLAHAGPERAITAGGALRFRWNDVVLRDFGLGAAYPLAEPSARSVRGVDFQLSGDSHFDVDGTAKTVYELVGGEALLLGGFGFENLKLQWQSPRLTVRGGSTPRIDFMSSDGEVWFYADRLMYEFVDDGGSFRVRTADLRASRALAELIGRPEFADHAVAELRLLAPVQQRSTAAIPKSCADPNWNGETNPAAPAGHADPVFRADVFMSAFSASNEGCLGCDGPAGASDGSIKFVPSSTLKNNVANGTLTATIPGDPLGTSTAFYTADVPWWEKFTTSPWPFPYQGNDQHPYLIWNLYRIDASGKITQVGRSGVKHAFLTTNGGCAPGENCTSHILGRSCSDTYGTGNNDNVQDLGPRSEIIPASGAWGRCGSIFDPDCNQSENPQPDNDFAQRMLVKESEIDPAVNPGATYLFESWYITHQDINIYNTMATRPVSFQWSGSTWPLNNNPPGSTGFKLGSAVDRWIDVAADPANRRISEIATAEGHAKVAVRVTDLGGSGWRYDYAVMNFDYARAVTTGAEVGHTLRVLSNHGFNRFTVTRNANASITDLSFADGDEDSGNDWTASTNGGLIEWNAPSAAASLNWGTMFRFSYVANVPPAELPVTLGVTTAGNPSMFQVNALATGADLSVNAPSNTTVLEDSNATLPVSVFDNETAPGALNLSSQSGDTVLLPNSGVQLGGSGSSRTLGITPAPNRFGSTQVTLTVTDADSNQATAVVNVTVTPVNDPPSLTLAALASHASGTAGVITVPGFVTAVNFGPNESQGVSAYQVAETSDPSNIVSGATIALDGTLSYSLSGAAGTANLTARVRDNGGTANGGVDLSPAVSFSIVVQDRLRVVAPNAINTNEDTLSNALTITVSDPESAATDLVLSATSDNPGVVAAGGLQLSGVGGSRTLRVNPVANASGSAVVTLTVRDPDQNTDTTQVTVTINPVNDAPSLTIGAVPNTQPGAAGTITVPGFVTGVDFGGGETQAVQHYVLTKTSDPTNAVGAASIGLDGTLVYNITGIAGVANFEARVRDNGGTANGGIDLSPPATFSITTQQALNVSAAATLAVREDSISDEIVVAVQDQQTPAASLVLTAASSDTDKLPLSGITLGGSGSIRTLRVQPAANAFGPVDVTLSVRDGDNNIANTVVRVEIAPVNDAPSLVLNAVPPTDGGFAGTFTVPNFVASVDYGPGGEYQGQQVLQYLVQEVSDAGNVVSAASVAADGTLTYTLTGNPGVAQLSIRVRDNGGTADGGADTSAPVSFSLGGDAGQLLRDGFESP